MRGGSGGVTSDPLIPRDLLSTKDFFGKPINYTAAQPVYPRAVGGEKTGVILIVGQSLCCNTVTLDGDPGAAGVLYTPSNARVHNLDPHDGAVRFAADPQRGCDQGVSGQGSMIGRLGDQLVNNSAMARPILLPFAVSGTSITRWTVGGDLHWRFAHAKRRIDALGLPVPNILWIQGTADATPGVAQSDWTTPFNAMATAIRALWPTAPIFVAKSTTPNFAGFVPSQTIRAAQAAVLNSGNLIYAAGDEDVITERNTVDNIHFTDVGAGKQAQAHRIAMVASGALVTVT